MGKGTRKNVGHVDEAVKSLRERRAVEKRQTRRDGDAGQSKWGDCRDPSAVCDADGSRGASRGRGEDQGWREVGGWSTNETSEA